MHKAGLQIYLEDWLSINGFPPAPADSEPDIKHDPVKISHIEETENEVEQAISKVSEDDLFPAHDLGHFDHTMFNNDVKDLSDDIFAVAKVITCTLKDDFVIEQEGTDISLHMFYDCFINDTNPSDDNTPKEVTSDLQQSIKHFPSITTRNADLKKACQNCQSHQQICLSIQLVLVQEITQRACLNLKSPW